MPNSMDSFDHKNETHDKLRYSVLYSDPDHVTHFRDEYMPWNRRSSGNSVTPLQDAKQIGFLRLHENLRTDWHPAPRKQFIMVLKGILEVEAGDGESRSFAPGSILLVTDTDCRGHRTGTMEGKEVMLVWVPVP